MNEEPQRIVAEKRIVGKMIHLYCRKNHGGMELCADCSELQSLAQQKLTRCPYGENKPTCRTCTTHCWGGEHRETIREVMRYAGPRMMIHHPQDALVHLFHETKAGRIIAMVLGWASLLLGLIGVVLPGLPTTPFVLLSAFLFAQSSPKFHQWLRGNRFFGKIIHSWESERAIPRGVKPKVLILLLITFTISITVAPLLPVKIFLAAIGTTAAICISRIPEQKSE